MSDVHVRLRVGREWYALPVDHVVSVVEIGAIARVPGSGPALAGVRNAKGAVNEDFQGQRGAGCVRRVVGS